MIWNIFKINYGFEEGGRFLDNLCDIDFNDLHLSSEKCRSKKCEELIVIIEIGEICYEREGVA